MAEPLFRSILKRARTVTDLSARIVGFRNSESKIERDAEAFWENSSSKDFGVNSHWRGHGIFQDDDPRWVSIGSKHLEIFKSLSGTASSLVPSKPSILEWGCGGGANAVAFAPISSLYVGVDIAKPSLDECERQLSSIGISHAKFVQVDVRHPERILTVASQVDVVLCTYVFELLPSKMYALKLIEVFFGLLNPGGVALVQIRYSTRKLSTQGRTWGYRFGFTKMVSFFLDDFWKACELAGFTPKCLTLVPTDPTVFDERYAYFLLEKPRNANEDSSIASNTTVLW